MGKIIRNGITYGGSSTIAGNVSYDNTTSGLTSVTVQNAITELKSLFDNSEHIRMVVVEELPVIADAQDNVVYLIDEDESGVYEMYIVAEVESVRQYIKIGETDVDLSNYLKQVDTMPTAASTELGKIIQYKGVTDTDYTHGYIYECVVDDATADPITYKWQDVPTFEIEGEKPILYVDVLPVPPNIKDVIYAIDETTAVTKTVGVDFLDEDTHFTKQGNRYIPNSGVTIERNGFEIVYIENPTGTDEVTYAYVNDEGDTVTETVTGGSFDYDIVIRNFYAGDAEKQTLQLLAENPEEVDHVGRFEYDNSGNITGEIFNTYSGVNKNIASGAKSRASGYKTEATGQFATASGAITKATDFCATAVGYRTTASGKASFAAGTGTVANALHSAAFGVFNEYKEIEPAVEADIALVDPAVAGHWIATVTEQQATDFEEILFISARSTTLADSPTGYGVAYKFLDSTNNIIKEGIITATGEDVQVQLIHVAYPDGWFNEGYPVYIDIVCDDTNASPHVVFKTESKGYLFAIGCGSDDAHRKNIVDVTDTIFNVNGNYYQNGQPLSLDGGAKIFIGTIAEWNALTLAEKTEYTQANIVE